jgi:hypothetical protein
MDDDKLSIGAVAIARDCFDDDVSTRQVYRLAEEGGWPIFRLRGKLTARRAAMRAELRRREAKATAAGAGP